MLRGPNMSIIFFDIDGTVMDLDGTIPPSAVTAVRRLRHLWTIWWPAPSPRARRTIT